jgi:hypothetical protein
MFSSDSESTPSTPQRQFSRYSSTEWYSAKQDRKGRIMQNRTGYDGTMLNGAAGGRTLHRVEGREGSTGQGRAQHRHYRSTGQDARHGSDVPAV